MHPRVERIELEALKLLIEVAWADHEVAGEEVDYILGLAAQLHASEAELESLRAALADEGRLPGPDLALLRGQRDRVLQAIDELIRIDHRIVADERAARDAIAALLDDG